MSSTIDNLDAMASVDFEDYMEHLDSMLPKSNRFVNEVTERGVAAQESYCKEKNLPFFIPANGVCFSCGQSIFEGDNAISVDKAGKFLITGCPHCSRTYCD